MMEFRLNAPTNCRSCDLNLVAIRLRKTGPGSPVKSPISNPSDARMTADGLTEYRAARSWAASVTAFDSMEAHASWSSAGTESRDIEDGDASEVVCRQKASAL